MARLRSSGWIEGAFWSTALVCAIAAIGQTVKARQGATEARLITPSTSQPGISRPQGVLGRLEIAQVGLAVPIVDDYGSEQLVRGVGHVPGSALPGGLGNLVLAGHRDTFFRPLRHVAKGMEIDVVTSAGRYRYSIDSTEIVTPDQLGVLDIGVRPEMTLITCFPFEYVGPAPRRFIVHAHLLSVEAA